MRNGRRVFLGHSIAIFGLAELSLVSCNSVGNDNTLIITNSSDQSKKEVKTLKLESSAFNTNATFLNFMP